MTRPRFFWIFFFLVYGALLFPLWTGRGAFVGGDYGLQFYPWMHAYAAALRAGTFPLWTDLMQSGFPLFAEGQTGMLYGLNLFVFALIPFKTAYNLVFLLHFLMGGWFAYALALRNGMSREAAVMTAILFCFSSAYAGCFYNVVTMRTLVWFPAMLYLVDSLLASKRWAAPLLALAAGQSWLGGFPQTTAYAVLFTGAYYFLKIREARMLRDWNKHALLAAALMLAAGMGLPQVWATWQLAAHSTRTLQEPGFALWGSFPLWSLSTLFMYPLGTFLQSGVYIGIIPLLLVLAPDQWRSCRIWWYLAILSFALAVGSLNPAYWLLAKLPLVSLLRNPSKFIFFTAFFLIMIAGFGFDRLRAENPRSEYLRKMLRRTAVFAACAAFLALTAAVTVRLAEPVLRQLGRWYVSSFVLNKSFHRWDLDTYLQKIERMLNAMRHELNPANVFFWLPFLWVGLFAAVIWLYRKQRIRQTVFLALLVLGVCADLFVYGKSGYGTGFLGNMGKYPDTRATEAYPKDGRWLDLTADRPLAPNANLLTGHAQVGAYSPLLDKNYYLVLKDWGVLDDSFGARPIDWKAAAAQRPMLDFLGVRHILTDRELDWAGLRLAAKMDGHFLYRNTNAEPEFSLEGAELESRYLSRQADLARIEIQAPLPSVLTRNVTYDRNWRAWLNGREVPLLRIGQAFQGVRVPAGRSIVEFRYAPSFWTVGLPMGLAAFFVALGWLILGSRR